MRTDEVILMKKCPICRTWHDEMDSFTGCCVYCETAKLLADVLEEDQER